MSDKQKNKSEYALFRAAMADIVPLRHNQVVHDTPKPSAIPQKTIEDEQQVLIDMLSDAYDPAEIQPGDILSYCGPGIQKTVFRKLKAGKYSISDEIDLHGMNSIQAREALLQYLQQVNQLDYCCVRIIHGKGRRSDNNGPVLKKKVDGWLRQHGRVLAFHSAKPVHGGTGAVYVLLKRRYD